MTFQLPPSSHYIKELLHMAKGKRLFIVYDSMLNTKSALSRDRPAHFPASYDAAFGAPLSSLVSERLD